MRRELYNYPTPSPELQKKIDTFLEHNDELDKISKPTDEEIHKVCDEQIELVKELLPREWISSIMPEYVVVAVDENDPLDPDGGSWLLEGISPDYPEKVELLSDPFFVRYKRMKLEGTVRSHMFDWFTTELITHFARSVLVEGEPLTPEIDYQVRYLAAVRQDFRTDPKAIHNLTN